MRISFRSQKGDTIVEVLLAIGIIALVLGGAYAATNKSLQYSRAAQERSEALKVAETQVERLKNIKDSNSAFNPTSPFCIKSDGITLKNSIADISNEPECLFGDRYYPSIEQDANGVFKVTVLWANATGTNNVPNFVGYDQLQLNYRAYSFDGSTVPFSLNAPVPTVTFSVAPGAVIAGGSATLTWSSTNSTACTASNAWNGAKTSSGSQSTGVIVPPQTYTLTCTGDGGVATKSVTVGLALAAPSINFAALPSPIAYNSSATLTWNTANAASCTASNAWSGAKAASGSQSTGPLTASKTYTLSCDNGAGGVTTVTRTVTVNPPVPTVSLTASKTAVDQTETVDLTWSSTNTTSCVASNAWNGNQALNGTVTTNKLISDSTFTLTCSGPGGSVAKSVSVKVLIEQLSYPPAARPTQYSRVCTQITEGFPWSISYYSLPLPNNGCAGGGTFLYDSSGSADATTYNRACQMKFDNRYAYIPSAYTSSLYCPMGGTMP